MTSSASTPMNFIGNAFYNMMHDPAAGDVSPLVAGVAVDLSRNAPIHLYSNIPHFETEVSDSEPGNVGSSAGS